MVVGSNNEPVRGVVSLSIARGEREPVLRDDLDELHADNHNDDAGPKLRRVVRVLVAAELVGVEIDSERLFGARWLFVFGPLGRGKCVRAVVGSMFERRVDDNDDARPLLALLRNDNDLDDLDDDGVFVELRVSLVDRVVDVVQNRRPVRGVVSLSLAVENVVGRRV